MLTNLAIEDYQALADVQLKLGRFTVVTGPTGAGKSAVIRALKLACFNQRGSSYIRHGRSSCQVILQDDTGLGLVLARGKGQDALVLDVLGEQRKYTKLGGAMPDEVAELLAMDPELNFAGQFDRPYLLDSSGAVIARMLGRLTNVDLVHEAARRGYARKLAVSRDLDRAQATVATLERQVQQYVTLPARRAAIRRAEEVLVRVQEQQQRKDRLEGLLAEAIETHRAALAARSLVEKLGPPSLGKLEQLAEERARVGCLIDEIEAAEADIAVEVGNIGLFTRQEQQAHADIHATLVSAGRCPTCGQVVKEDA